MSQVHEDLTGPEDAEEVVASAAAAAAASSSSDVPTPQRASHTTTNNRDDPASSMDRTDTTALIAQKEALLLAELSATLNVATRINAVLCEIDNLTTAAPPGRAGAAAPSSSRTVAAHDTPHHPETPQNVPRQDGQEQSFLARGGGVDANVSQLHAALLTELARPISSSSPER